MPVSFFLNGSPVEELPPGSLPVEPLGDEQKTQLAGYLNNLRHDEGYRRFMAESATGDPFQAAPERDIFAEQAATIGATIESYRNGTSTPPDAPDVGSIDEVISECGDEEFIVVPRVIKGRTWYVRRHDALTLLDLETKRLDVERGQVKRNPSREVKIGLAMEFVASLYRRTKAATKTEPAQYEVMFKDTDAAQNFFKKPNALDLVNELAEAIYSVNKSLDPLNKLRAAEDAQD